MKEELYRDDFIAILCKQDGFYIQSFQNGMSLESFNTLMKQFPNIKVTGFLAVRKALINAPFGPELFGVEKERISVDVSGDHLEATIILNIPQEELTPNKRGELTMDIMDALRKADVNYGIQMDVLKGDLSSNKPITIARGIPPVNGKDAEIKMYEIKDPKPQIVDNGKVNHYNLNLIHQVQTGAWLGERIDPIPGTPGKTVHGTELLPAGGSYLPLPYDHSSVELVREDGKDVLYSLKTGAVHYIGDSIAVYDVMDINGDVDFNTGSIDFNGYVSVKGSVEENFSIHAKKDIEISGEYGIGGVDTIQSSEANIYIRGGIAGKNRAKIICKKNLYVKYLSDVDVICEGNVYVGFYIRNANIKAKQVIVDSPRGQIVGGVVEADIRVECADIGNWMENRTKIIVRGFSQTALKTRIDDIIDTLTSKKEQLAKLKLLSKKPEDHAKKNTQLSQKALQALRTIQEDIRNLERERLNLTNFLRTPGEGAVIVKKRIYPKVKLIIQGSTLEISEEVMAPTYIAKQGIIQVL